MWGTVCVLALELLLCKWDRWAPNQSCSSQVSLEREVRRAVMGSEVQGGPSQGPELGSTAGSQRAGNRAQPQWSVNTGRAELNSEGSKSSFKCSHLPGREKQSGKWGKETGVF